MNDQDFLAALERCELAAVDFDHVAHVRAGYLYLCAHGFGGAIERMSAAIRRYAAHLGATDKYNETVTVAWIALIRQHMSERGAAGGWPAFRAANPELFARGVLDRYYDRPVLDSALARRTFVLPLRSQLLAMILAFGFAGVLAAVPAPAFGRECRGISLPERVQVAGTGLVLNGLGVRKATFLRINVYVAGLYVARPGGSAEALLADAGPQQLTLQFLRNVGAGDLRKAWHEGFEHSAGPRLPALEERIRRLTDWMSDMHTGEQMSFVRLPGQGVQVSIGGAGRGTIPGEDFAQALLAIFLGPLPPNAELKAGLLGGPCG